MEVVEPAASKVGEWLVPLVIRHCGYMICSDRYVRERNEEVKKLVMAKQRMQHSIDEAKRNQRRIEADVEKWMEDAENAIKEARPAQAHGPTLPSVDEMGIPPITGNGEAKKTCFCGWLPNLKERYRLGREAKKTVKDIRELIARGQFLKVDFEKEPPGLVVGPTDLKSLAGDGGDTITDSRASLFQGIMKAVDDEKLKVIGVHGPGGIGKSTLLEEVEKKLRKEGKPFKMIAKSTVSQNLDMKKIQYDIAYAFRLNLNDEPSEVGKRDLLRKTIKEYPERVLIILDDLWDTLDLKEVGIPLGEESNKCQLLLASRDGSVLEQKMGAHPTFHLEGLSNVEAFRLFEKICGDKLKDDEGFKAKAAQVVEKLAGLPLLINSVASTLKCGDESTWDTALIKIEDPNIKSIVEWSYGGLKSDETESLFLLCGFIGGSIRVELLLGLGMGLDLFEGFDMTIRSSRSKLNEMLRRLRSICLLQDGGDDKESVTIHGLYSEAVISTPLTGQNSLITHRNAGSWPKKKLKKCWVCLVNVVRNRLAELRLYRFPDSKIFMLSEHGKGYCDALDFKSMTELRVLYFRLVKFTGFGSLNKILQKLQSLYFEYCEVQHWQDVANLGKLKALQVLSFAGSSISCLPAAIGELTKLKLLNLTYCYTLREIEPGALGGLINLEELYMRESFSGWMGEDEGFLYNALAELKHLRKLTTLEICISDPTVLLKVRDLSFGKLIRFWIQIGHAWGKDFEGVTTMMLDLNGEGYDGILSIEWVQETLRKTQYLYLDGFKEFRMSAYKLCNQGFSELKHLDIRNCSLIKHIVNSSDGAFPLLESLFLENLTHLEKVCDGPKCFSKLKVIRVTNCDRLEYMWCLSQRHDFALVEEIVVHRCDSMQAIIIDDVVADDRVELPNVRCLELAKLPKMTNFCIGAEITLHGAPIQIMDSSAKKFISYPHGKKEAMTATSESQYACSDSFFDRKVNLPSLEELSFWSVGSFKSIWPHELPKRSLDNLNEIYDSNCSELLNVFLSTHLGRLHNLKNVRIQDCHSLESVFECGSCDSNTEQTRILLPDLETIDIKGCPSLESVFDCSLTENKIVSLPKLESMTVDSSSALRHVVKSNSQTFLGFPSLEEVNVNDCLELRYLFPYGTATTLEKLKRLSIKDCGQMKEMVAKEEGDRSEAGALSFPSLTSLDIARCFEFKAFVSNPTSVERPSDEMVAEIDKLRRPFFNEMVNLPSLKRLSFQSVGSFKSIWPRELPKRSLDNLNEIYFSECSKLLNVFLSTHLGRLHSLKNVRIQDCHSLESVFECGSCDSNTEQTRVLLPELETIDIKGCPSLESVFDCGSLTKHKIVSLPKLGSLTVESSSALRHVVKSNSQNFLSFPSLEEVNVNDCLELRYLFPYGTATTLEKLKRLSIKDCGQMKEMVAKEEGDRSEAGALSFPSLTCLDIARCFEFKAFVSNPTSVERPSDEMVIEIDELRRPFFNEMVNLPSLERLSFQSVGSFKSIWPHELPARSLDNLNEINVSECSELLNVFLSTHLGRLHNLKNVRIRNCGSLESVFECGSCDSNTEQTRVLLPDLETIHIEGCPSWESVCDCGSLTENKIVSLPKLESMTVDSSGALRHVVKSNSQTFLGFPSLEEVNVNDCLELRYLFPYGTATTLEKLKRLSIKDCGQMKEMVAKEEGGPSKASLLSFPSLTTLIISQCPNFGAFIPNPTSVERPLDEMAKENDESRQPFFNEMVTFPILIMVEMRGVQVKELWNNQIHVDSFGKLESLQLVNCDNLRCIAPSHVWKKLQSCLIMLEVKSCRSIEIIYESDTTVADTCQLRSLILNDLENLRHIWRYDSLPNINVPFPNLRDIEVRRCPRLRMLFGTFTASFLGQIKWLEVESCDDMELIADHGECEEATCTTITFSELVALKLEELPKFRSYLPEKYHVEFPPLRVLIRVGCGKEPDQSDGSDLVGWEEDRAAERNQAINDRILSSEDGSEDEVWASYVSEDEGGTSY